MLVLLLLFLLLSRQLYKLHDKLESGINFVCFPAKFLKHAQQHTSSEKEGGGGEGRPDPEGHRSCSCSLAWAWAPLMMSTFCRYLSPLALWSRKSTVVEELVPCRRLTQFPSGTLLPARLLTSLLTPLTLALLPSSFHLTSLCMWAAIVVLFSTLPCVRAHKQLFMHKKLKCKEYLAYPLPSLSSARPCGRFAGNDKALKMSWHKFWSAARTRGYNEAVTNCVKQLKRDSRAPS